MEFCQGACFALKVFVEIAEYQHAVAGSGECIVEIVRDTERYVHAQVVNKVGELLRVKKRKTRNMNGPL